MRNTSKVSIIVLLLLIAIGFAAVTTNLIVNNSARIGSSQDEFDVYFLSAESEQGGTATISEDKKSINYSTKTLSSVGDEAYLNYTVTNDSYIYDANVTVNVLIDDEHSDLFNITMTGFNNNSSSLVEARSFKNGRIVIRLLEPVLEDIAINFSVSLNVTAEERIELVEESLNSPKSIYSWSEVNFLEHNIASTLDTLEEYEVNDLYQSISSSDFDDYKELYKTVIPQLNDRGINTYFLVGEPSAYNDFNKNKLYIDLADSYNSTVDSNQQVKGVVFDVEAYLDDTYKANPIQGFKAYADTFEQVYAYASSKNLKVVLVIPYWYDTSYQGDSYTTEEKALASDTFNRLFQYADRISVMNYYKTNMVNAISNEISAASINGIEIESIVNMRRPDEGDKTTIWVNDDPFGDLNTYWIQIDEAYDYDKLLYSYHDLNSLLELNNLYETYKFIFVNESNEVIDVSGKKYLTFSNEDNYLTSAKKSLAIPKDLTFTMTLTNYTVNNMVITDIGDNTKEVTVTVTEFSKNTLEVYSKLYNSDKTSYSTISEGTIYLKDIVNNVTHSKTIRSAGYAAFSNISSTIPFEVTIVVNDKTYYLEHATAKNDANEVITIVDDDKHLVIPEGIKSSKYVTPTFYFIEK